MDNFLLGNLGDAEIFINPDVVHLGAQIIGDFSFMFAAMLLLMFFILGVLCFIAFRMR